MAAVSEDVILLDDTLTETFLTDLQSRGRTEETLKCYRNSLGKLCGFLPGRRLSHEAMCRWPEALREQGYCPSTINSAVSAANSLLAFCGRRGWQVMPSPLPETEQPELTREEYLRLLQTARILEKERAYLLVKLLGTTGLPVHLLDEVTISAVQDGGLPEYDMQLCGSLKDELLDFAGREGILSGPIFVTRRGTPVGRTTVTSLIQSLAHDAQVEAGKCTPRCLRKLYLQTQERIRRNISALARAEYEKLLLSEQEKAGWNIWATPHN